MQTGFSKARIDLDRTTKMQLGCREIPLDVQVEAANAQMRFGQRVVQLEGAPRCEL
jgi:hypothetical protein